MSSKRSASMIIGISMGLETCQIFGQVSHNLLCWKKNLLTDICGPGRDWRENRSHPGQIIYDQNSGSQRESTPSWRRSISGLMKNSILKAHEKCERSISSTRGIRNSKKPSRTRVRSWKHQWLLLCLVKIMKNCGSGGSNKIKTKLAWYSGSWWIHKNAYGKFDTASSWRPYCRKKERIHYSTKISFTSLFLCLKLWKFLQRKQRWTRNGKNWRKFRRGTWQKSEKQERGDRWNKDVGDATVHFASLMDICHLKNAELEAKHKVRVELYSVVIL